MAIRTWLQLFRWKNLLFLSVLQTACWLFAVLPWKPYFISITNAGLFLLLLFSTAAIAAAGYLINDLYDQDTDLLNRGQPVLATSGITNSRVWTVYALMNLLGLIAAAFVAVNAGRPEWVLFQLLVIGSLWLYSSELKRRVLYGNVLVALLSALSLLTWLLYEPSIRDYELIPAFKCLPPALVISGLAIHAWWTTLMRELVKDLEDQHGDEESGCTTFPIVYGRMQSLRLLVLYAAGFICSLIAMTWYLVSEHFWLTAAYLVFIIVGYSTTIVRPVYMAQTSADWKMNSARFKLLMQLGCAGLFIYFIELCLPSY